MLASRLGVLVGALLLAACTDTAESSSSRIEQESESKAALASTLDQTREKAEQGEADAQFNLGLLYANGEGVPQDYAEARTWYLKAAEQGDAKAQFNLGLLYSHGWGVPQDKAEART
jgi:TPR repeat protein